MAPRAVQDAIGDDRGGDLRPATLVHTDRLSVLVDMDREAAHPSGPRLLRLKQVEVNLNNQQNAVS
jgi:hypothetical protein